MSRTAEAAHAPGPWKAAPTYTGGLGSKPTGYLIEGRGRTIAAFVADEATARLMASAPELLEALQYVMTAHGEQLTDAFDMASAAIARATKREG